VQKIFVFHVRPFQPPIQQAAQALTVEWPQGQEAGLSPPTQCQDECMELYFHFPTSSYHGAQVGRVTTLHLFYILFLQLTGMQPRLEYMKYFKNYFRGFNLDVKFVIDTNLLLPQVSRNFCHNAETNFHLLSSSCTTSLSWVTMLPFGYTDL
jgi:hypothetical protein